MRENEAVITFWKLESRCTDLTDLKKMNLKPAGGSAGKTGDTKEPKRFRKLVASVISMST